MTLDQLLERPAAVAVGGFEILSGGGPEENEEDKEMTKDEIKAKHPDAYKAIFAEGAAQAAQDMMPTEDCEKKKEAVKKEGAAAELARIKAVHALGKKMPGHMATIEALMFDGKTTGPEAAMAIIEAEGGKREKHLADYKADGKDVLVPVVDGAAAEAAAEAAAKKPEDKTLPVEERAKAVWDASVEIRAEFSGKYETFLAYYKAEDAGTVKVIGKK
jgi:hypothetical protein